MPPSEWSAQYKTQTIARIALFFGFHTALTQENDTLTQKNYDIAAETLGDWLLPPSKLYMITNDSQIVGFLRLSYRGANVAWIEDIFVDQPYRLKLGYDNLSIVTVRKEINGSKYDRNISFADLDFHY